MIKIPVETPTATLRYALAPDEAGIAAIEATFAAYDRMMAILAEVAPSAPTSSPFTPRLTKKSASRPACRRGW
jgi:hypothetical protein